MIRCNLHTHTDRSDGICSAEHVVIAALEKGFRTLGFSDHSHTPWLEQYTLPSDIGPYILGNLELAARYRDRIEIVCGIENEFDSWQDDERLQYRIGSRHCLPIGDGHFLIDETPELLEQGINDRYGGSGAAAAADYYRLLASDVSRHRPEIIGHFDLIRKFNRSSRFFDENGTAYRRAALEAAEAAGSTGGIFEINTSNIARKRRHIFYPADFILRFILEHGYPVIIGSDAHDPSLLSGGFSEAVLRLWDIGFRSVTVWENGCFRQEDLAEHLINHG